MIGIKSNAMQVARQLERAAKQVPFATARALTWTAKDAQAEVKKELPQRFTIRNRWVEMGIRIKPATKTTLQAEIGTVDAFMAKHEFGGIKKPKGKHLAIPTEAARTGKRGKIPKSKRPRVVLKSPKAFIGTSKKTGKQFIAIRKRKDIKGRYVKGKYRAGKKSPLTFLYTLSTKARIKPRWGFMETVERTVARRYERNFKRSLELAMRSAR